MINKLSACATCRIPNTLQENEVIAPEYSSVQLFRKNYCGHFVEIHNRNIESCTNAE